MIMRNRDQLFVDQINRENGVGFRQRTKPALMGRHLEFRRIIETNYLWEWRFELEGFDVS